MFLNYKEINFKVLIFFIAVFFFLYAGYVYGLDLEYIKTKDADIFFESHLDSAAINLAGIYPLVKRDLEKIFGWSLNLKPSIVLIKKRENFIKLSHSNLIAAFAVPEKALIVIDYSKMVTKPFNIEITLKHEVCHLLLHHHIKYLPRWLDEGLAQWVSGGIAEVIRGYNLSFLNRAALSGRFIQFSALNESFPQNKNAMFLAYEESKSFVSYIVNEFGTGGLMNVLNRMKDGQEIERAFLKGLGISLYDLEKEWQSSLQPKWIWLAFLGQHIYEILFLLMPLITIYAFIKLLIKKRKYKDFDDEDDSESGDYKL
ncbi:conserved hypothetical protein [Candidatus Magnetomoraceae bacterium gMMP-15]